MMMYNKDSDMVHNGFGYGTWFSLRFGYTYGLVVPKVRLL